MTARTPKVGEVWNGLTCLVDEADTNDRYVWRTANGWYLVHRSGDLTPPPEPLPELWINVYPPEAIHCHATCDSADRAASHNRIGVIHLHPDGTVEFTRTT